MRWRRSTTTWRPGLGQHLVGELGVGPAGRATGPADGLVGQHEPLGSAVATATRRGVRAPASAGHQRHQRLVLDGPAQRRERPLVVQVREAGPAVEAEQEVGAALVLAQGLDEQRGAVRPGGRVRRSSPGRRREGLERGQGHAHRGQAGAMASAVGRRDGAPKATTAAAPATQPTCDGDEGLEPVGLSSSGERAEEDDGGPGGTTPPPGHPRRGGGDHGGDRRGGGQAGDLVGAEDRLGRGQPVTATSPPASRRRR